MAAVRHPAILDLLKEVVGPPTRAHSWWLSSVKFRRDRFVDAEVISIWIFLLFTLKNGLKVLLMGPKFEFLRVWLPKFRGTSFRPERAHRRAEWRVWAVFVPDRTRRVLALCICRLQAFPISEHFGKFRGPQLPQQTSQKNSTSKALPLQHGITESILQCNRWVVCRGGAFCMGK